MAAAVHLSDKLQLVPPKAAPTKSKASKAGTWGAVILTHSLWSIRVLLWASRLLPFAIQPPAILAAATTGVSFSQTCTQASAERDKAMAIVAAVGFLFALALFFFLSRALGA